MWVGYVRASAKLVVRVVKGRVSFLIRVQFPAASATRALGEQSFSPKRNEDVKWPDSIFLCVSHDISDIAEGFTAVPMISSDISENVTLPVSEFLHCILIYIVRMLAVRNISFNVAGKRDFTLPRRQQHRLQPACGRFSI